MSDKYTPSTDKEKLEYLLAINERRDTHYKLLNTKIDELTASQRQIVDLLAGTNLNGNKGMVKLLETVEEKVNTNQEQIRDIKKDVDNAKFWGKWTTVTLTGLILIIANYFKELMQHK